MNDINTLFFELIQVALGVRICLSRMPDDMDWKALYDMAKKQSLVGICFAGVKRLQKTEYCMPVSLFMQWLAMAAKIQQRNGDMDQKTAEVWGLLNKAGLKCAVLKGQGVAELYEIRNEVFGIRNESLGMLRQSGDIDVWVKGGFDVVNDFVQNTRPTDDIAYHRFHYDMYADTEVELHHRPTLMRNLFDDRRLQQWCDSFGADTFVMTEKGFAVPSLEFNRIFILTHIYRHFLFEGIGLRQLMDYYFVLQAADEGRKTKDESVLLKEFRLTRFAGALMWVMGHVFAMNREYMICEPNEEEGRFLLEEIMQMGNFGQQDKRYKGDGKTKRFVKHWSHLLLHYPSEVVWSPIWIVYHWFWKRNKLKAIS